MYQAAEEAAAAGSKGRKRNADGHAVKSGRPCFLVGVMGLVCMWVAGGEGVSSLHVLYARVAVLHCLQRLAGHPLLAEQLLNAPGALGRLWAGADHIVAEGA